MMSSTSTLPSCLLQKINDDCVSEATESETINDYSEIGGRIPTLNDSCTSPIKSRQNPSTIASAPSGLNGTSLDNNSSEQFDRSHQLDNQINHDSTLVKNTADSVTPRNESDSLHCIPFKVTSPKSLPINSLNRLDNHSQSVAPRGELVRRKSIDNYYNRTSSQLIDAIGNEDNTMSTLTSIHEARRKEEKVKRIDRASSQRYHRAAVTYHSNSGNQTPPDWICRRRAERQLANKQSTQSNGLELIGQSDADTSPRLNGQATLPRHAISDSTSPALNGQLDVRNRHLSRSKKNGWSRHYSEAEKPSSIFDGSWLARVDTRPTDHVRRSTTSDSRIGRQPSIRYSNSFTAPFRDNTRPGGDLENGRKSKTSSQSRSRCRQAGEPQQHRIRSLSRANRALKHQVDELMEFQATRQQALQKAQLVINELMRQDNPTPTIHLDGGGANGSKVSPSTTSTSSNQSDSDLTCQSRSRHKHHGSNRAICSSYSSSTSTSSKSKAKNKTAGCNNACNDCFSKSTNPRQGLTMVSRELRGRAQATRSLLNQLKDDFSQLAESVSKIEERASQASHLMSVLSLQKRQASLLQDGVQLYPKPEIGEVTTKNHTLLSNWDDTTTTDFVRLSQHQRTNTRPFQPWRRSKSVVHGPRHGDSKHRASRTYEKHCTSARKM